MRAIITDLDEDQALRDQLLENVERRDLSFIERALVAVALLQGDQLAASERSNKGVAEVLNLTEAGVSQLISVVRTVGDELVQAIGAAPGIGRPRWEELKRALSPAHVPVTELVSRALAVRTDETTAPGERSDQAFLAVLAASRPALPVTEPAAPATEDAIQLDGIGSASLRRSARGKRLQLDLRVEDRRFIDWFEGNAPELIRELHGRWQRSGT